MTKAEHKQNPMYSKRRTRKYGVWLAVLLCGGFCAVAEIITFDYADSRLASFWLRHPVYGDASFDAFERLPDNPIYRGKSPYAWPVNGFFFPDPASASWYVFVGEYGEGYLYPPSRCVLLRSTNRGRDWTHLGVILEGDRARFDRGGHTPDVSVVYAEGRYHMVYDWGEADFNKEGGLAYAWAERPEGPWHRVAEPITRNSTLSKMGGRYNRTYAATLLRRKRDWLILAMMDHPPHSWALFAMTAPRPEGPWSERRLIRNVEDDCFHPPLLEFFPAFVHESFVYAPATSVALNRNYQAIFHAPLEAADQPSAWKLWRNGSVWHAEDVEHEHYGIWGQTFSGAVDRRGMLTVMFPSRDSKGNGTINLAAREWKTPFRKRGFVLSGHQGPALTLLRRGYRAFTLETEFELRGTATLLIDYEAVLNPSAPMSGATLHPAMNCRHTAVEFSPGQWRLLRLDENGGEQTFASGSLPASGTVSCNIRAYRNFVAVHPKGQPPAEFVSLGEVRKTLLMGLRTGTNSHLEMKRFKLGGNPEPVSILHGCIEAMLGAGESSATWEERRGPEFRSGLGAVSMTANARAKWNVIGSDLVLWAPRGPELGKMELRLDGSVIGEINLYSDKPEASREVWRSGPLADSPHALVVQPKSGRIALDALEVISLK